MADERPPDEPPLERQIECLASCVASHSYEDAFEWSLLITKTLHRRALTRLSEVERGLALLQRRPE